MVRLTTIVWLLCQALLSVQAQPGYNITPELGYFREHFRRIIVHNDTVVAYGIAFSADTQQCLLVARFDTNGVKIDDKLICDTSGLILTMDINWSKVIKCSDGGYALTAALLFNFNGAFIKLSPNLEVEFVKEYVDSVNLVEFYNAVFELPDGYLLGGYVQNPNYQIEPFIRRVDAQGNSLWIQYYGDYDISDLFAGSIKLNDSLYAFAGSYRINPDQLGGRGPWISCIDIHGDIVKEWRPQNNVPFELLHGISKISADKWLVWGVNTVSGPPFNHQFFLASIDTNFQVDMVRPYGPVRPQLDFIWDVSPTADDNFIGAGYWYAENPNTGPDIYGRLFKFSPAPDSLWSLTLTAPIPNPDISGNYLGGVGLLSSGNMIAGGYALAGNEVWPWLVKVTPDGCVDSLWCVSVPSSAPETARRPGGRVYPNPARDYFYLDWPGDFPSGAIRLTLTAPDGRTVSQQWIGPGEPVWVAGLPAGLYYWQAETGRGQWQRGTVAVQR
ncbi:MAG: T9SS type A sorting domain-containing protein [Saprospiraceae bacterium]|nr:T9SS type A sorting domain-containing protein [Saprospiraceae bacterium]